MNSPQDIADFEGQHSGHIIEQRVTFGRTKTSGQVVWVEQNVELECRDCSIATQFVLWVVAHWSQIKMETKPWEIT